MSPQEQLLRSSLDKFENGELDNLLETKSGVKYIIHEDGDGWIPTRGQTVLAHYIGCLMKNNRIKFASSIDRDKPFPFKLGVGQVVKGWDDTISLFKIGTKATIFVPSELAYGRSGVGGQRIPPNADVAFYIAVLGAE